MPLKSKIIYLLLTLFTSQKIIAQNGDGPADFTKSMLNEEHYVNYTSHIAFKLTDNKLVYDYALKKEAYYGDDKNNYSGPQTINYSDYYTDKVKLTAYMMCIGKSGNYHRQKIKTFYSKTVASDGIFYEDQIQRYFILPGVKKGDCSVLNFSCRGIDPLLTSRYIFNMEMPVKQLRYTIEIPDYVQMRFVFVGDSSGITHTIKKEKNKTIHEYSAQNRKAIDFEDQAEDIAYYTPHLFIIPVSYKSENKEITLAGTTDNLFKYYNQQINKIDSSNNVDLNRLSLSLTANVTDTLSKIKIIYDWVQKNIKYVAFEEGPNGFIPRPAEKIYSKKYGDCKDKANLLISMLQPLNIKAFYTWVGTRSKPYAYRQLPSPHVDNHMICALKYKGQWLYLDPTAYALEYNYPSAFVQGKEALIRLSDSTYAIEKIPEVQAKENYRVDSLVININNDNLNGSGIQKNAGYYKDNLNTMLSMHTTCNNCLNTVALGNNKMRLSNFQIENKPDEDLKFSYQLNLPDYLQKFNDEIYVNMNLVKDLSDKQIDTEKRKHDITNEFKYELVQHIQLNIPEGKKVAQLPENRSFQHDQFSFDIKYSREKDHIIYDKKITLNHLLLKKENFKAWNDMIEQLNKAYSEVILIKSK